MTNPIDQMDAAELKAAMLRDGEYGEGFSTKHGPAWVHKDGLREPIPRFDDEAMRAYLASKAA